MSWARRWFVSSPGGIFHRLKADRGLMRHVANQFPFYFLLLVKKCLWRTNRVLQQNRGEVYIAFIGFKPNHYTCVPNRYTIHVTLSVFILRNRGMHTHFFKT
jgi:hypothetical protein